MGHKRGLDPFLALAAAASVTSTLLLGTGVCLVPARDPILFAKEVATLDLLSGGRLLLGVGAGWNREEIADHGVDPSSRFDVMADRIAAAKALWASDVAEYHGPHVAFEPTWQWPKPVQKPHPPILVGGQVSTALDRVVEYGDGWMPFVGHTQEGFEQSMIELREKLEGAGRPMVPVSVFGVAANDLDFSRFVMPGVERIIYRLPPSERADAVEMLETLASKLRLQEGMT
jgi:probable F420-dependent oxidoreductase